MLYIMYRVNYENKEASWHVGDKLPEIPVHAIKQIQMDGDEADRVNEIMGGGINCPVQHYYGDLARTIYLNLRGNER